MAGIYIHIPFCSKACHYCNFHFITSLKYKNEMIEALLSELELRKDFLAEQKVETVYFGGGTPSLMDDDDIFRLMDKVHKFYKPVRLLEVTLEANPDDITPQKSKAWQKAGIDRLSIGVQSFYEDDLLYMNRSHTSSQAERSIKTAQDAGIDNLSIDLIFGYPLLTDAKWAANLQRVVEYKIPHVSTYAMTIEPKTALDAFVKKGKIKPIDPEQSASQYEYLMEFMKEGGFEHYEISSFALPGKRAVHNSNYWNGTPYLGIGPSAHSFDGNSRQWNVAVNAKYMDGVSKRSPMFEQEKLTQSQIINELIMIRLRTSDGLNPMELKAKLSDEQWTGFDSELHILREKRWIFDREGHICLTDTGKLYADGIASMLFLS